jgi:hypothetical protein
MTTTAEIPVEVWEAAETAARGAYAGAEPWRGVVEAVARVLCGEEPVEPVAAESADQLF